MDGNNKKELLLIILSVFLFSLIAGLLGTVLPLYLLEEKFTVAEIGFSFAIASLLFAFGNVGLGAFSDYIGRKKFIIISIMAMVVSSLLLGMLPIFSLFIAGILVVIARMLSMMSSGLFYNFMNIRLADFGKKERGWIFGLYIFGSGGGVGLGMILFSYLLRFLPFNQLFYVGAGLASLSLIFFMFTRDFVQKQAALKLRDLFQIKLSSAAKLMLLTTFILLFSFGVVDYFMIPIYLKDVFHASNSAIVFILGFTVFLYGLISIYAGKHIDRRNEFHVAMVAAIAVSILSIFLGLANSLLLFIIIWTIDYIFWSFGDPARFKIIADMSDKERGKMISLFGLAVALGQAAGFASGEKIVDLLGYKGMFYLRAALFFIVAVLMIMIHKLVRR